MEFFGLKTFLQNVCDKSSHNPLRRPWQKSLKSCRAPASPGGMRELGPPGCMSLSVGPERGPLPQELDLTHADADLTPKLRPPTESADTGPLWLGGEAAR